MGCCILFGGAGYIGTYLAEFLLQQHFFDVVHIADVRESRLKGQTGISTSVTDVRKTIPVDIVPEGINIDWIFNIAAIHREPGHAGEEYFTTNISGAENISEFAEHRNCPNIFFFSSISVYGPAVVPLDEYRIPMPSTPYGSSKLAAEYIHKIWLQKDPQRKLIICRPGVVYGPGDPGNILRMIKAIQSGLFFLPVSSKLKKSYGYIFGLLNSVSFSLSQPNNLLVYNYVETPTQELGEMINIIKEELGVKTPVIRVPFFLLYAAAKFFHLLNINKNIHPVRVKKLATSTHIVPKVLLENKFIFEYDFRKSLIHWREKSPKDFNS